MASIRDIELKNTKLFLKNYSDDVVDMAQQEILRKRNRQYRNRSTNSPIESSGSGRRSLNSIETKDGYDIEGNDYLEDIDEGTSSTNSSISDIMKWIKVKPLKSDKGGSISSSRTKTLARLIQKSLVFNGIKPTMFLTDAVSNSVARLNGIENETAKDVVDNIESILEDYGYIKKGEKYTLDKKI